jgi:hypothetical protein
MLVLTLHIPWVQQRMLEAFVHRAAEASGLEIQVGGFRWLPFSRLRLFDLRVADSGDEILACAEVQLGYRLSLRHPFLHATDLTLKEPQLRLSRDAAGKWNIPGKRLPAASHEGGSERAIWPSMAVAQVEVDNGTLVVLQQGREEPLLRVENFHGSLAVLIEAVTGGGGLRLRLNRFDGVIDAPRQLGRLQAQGEAEWRGGEWRLSSLELWLADNSRMVVGGAVRLQPSLEVRLNAQLDPFDLSVVPGVADRLGGAPLVNGSLDLTATAARWELRHDLHVAPRGRLEGIFTFDAAGSPPWGFGWNATLREMDIPAAGEFPGASVSGTVSLALHGTSAADVGGVLRCHLDPSTLAGEALERGDLEVTYERGDVHLQTLTIASAVGRVFLSGRADLRGLWDAGHAGKVNLKAQILGMNLEKLSRGRVKIASFEGAADLDGSYAAGGLEHPERWSGNAQVQLHAPQALTLKANGHLDKQQLAASYAVTLPTLQQLKGLLPAGEPEGHLVSEGSLQGRWPEVAWDGKIALSRFRWDRLRCESCVITGRGPLLGKTAQRSVKVQASGLSLGEATVRSGLLEAEQKGSACRFKISAERIANQGTLQVAGEISNLWALPTRLVFHSGQAGWKNLTWRLAGEGTLGEEAVAVERFQLTRGDQRLQVRGKVSWVSASELLVTGEGLQLAEWLEPLGLSQTVQGVFNGRAQLSGSPQAPLVAFEGTLHGAQLNVQMPVESRLKGAYNNRQVTLSGQLLTGTTDPPVTFGGALPVHFSIHPFRWEILREQPLWATLQADFLNLERLRPMFPMLEVLSGRFAVDAKIGGTWTQWQLSARGGWHDGSLRVKGWPHTADKIQLDWDAESSRVHIRRANLELLGGRVQAGGEVGLSAGGITDFALRARAEEVQIPETFGIRGKGSGDFALLRSGAQDRLSGTFHFSKAEMNLGEFELDLARNIQVVEAEGQASVIEVSGSKQGMNPYFEALTMDLLLELPPSGTWVRGKGLDAEVAGAVRLAKNPGGRLQIDGRLQSLRGTYSVQSYQVQIVEAELVFLGVAEPIPTLQVLGEKDIQGVTIQVRVSGPVTQPKLVLSSIPPMDQVDILSYLLFGRPATDLTTNQTAGLQQNAVFFLGSEASRELKQLFGTSLLAPDVLQLRSSERGGVVEIGKYITPDFYVTYEKGLTGEQGDQVQIEYQLNRHLSIRSQFGFNQPQSVQSQPGQRDQSGVDLLLRYDFGD